MKKFVVKIWIMLFAFSLTACFPSDGSRDSDCTQSQIDWFWQDLTDNGVLDFSHECGGQIHPPTPNNGFGIDAPESKQPDCDMKWALEWNVPVYGPYNLGWTPQSGAMSYEVVITGPDGEQTTLTASSSDLVLMMQDFPEDEYSFEIRAKDFAGNYICSISTSFKKPVAEVPGDPKSLENIQPLTSKQKGSGGSSEEGSQQQGASSSQFIIVPIVTPFEQPK